MILLCVYTQASGVSICRKTTQHKLLQSCIMSICCKTPPHTLNNCGFNVSSHLCAAIIHYNIHEYSHHPTNSLSLKLTTYYKPVTESIGHCPTFKAMLGLGLVIPHQKNQPPKNSAVERRREVFFPGRP